MQVRWHKLQIHALHHQMVTGAASEEIFLHFKQIQHYKAHGVGIEIVGIKTYWYAWADNAAANDHAGIVLSYGKPANGNTWLDLLELAGQDRCLYFHMESADFAGTGSAKSRFPANYDNLAAANNGVLVCTPYVRVLLSHPQDNGITIVNVYYKLVQLSIQEWLTVANRQVTDFNDTL